MQFFLFPLLSALLFACSVTDLSQNNNAMQQGIRGKVILREGNFMPGPNRPNQAKDQVAVREIIIYELTNTLQVKMQNGFYHDITTKQIAKVTSAPDGSFQVALKSGKYSLFTKEPAGLFANLLDGDGYIFPVEVQANQVTPVEFVIDYKASY